MDKTLREHIICGKIIVFNSLLAKNRKAFCIDLNEDNSIIYRGLFGLKVVSKKVFLGFAKVVDVFDYTYALDIVDSFLLKKVYLEYRKSLFKNNKKVCDFVKELYSKFE